MSERLFTRRSLAISISAIVAGHEGRKYLDEYREGPTPEEYGLYLGIMSIHRREVNGDILPHFRRKPALQDRFKFELGGHTSWLHHYVNNEFTIPNGDIFISNPRIFKGPTPDAQNKIGQPKESGGQWLQLPQLIIHSEYDDKQAGMPYRIDILDAFVSLSTETVGEGYIDYLGGKSEIIRPDHAGFYHDPTSHKVIDQTKIGQYLDGPVFSA